MDYDTRKELIEDFGHGDDLLDNADHVANEEDYRLAALGYSKAASIFRAALARVLEVDA